MEKQLYHIKSNICNQLIHLRDVLNSMNIENQIDSGGIHLQLSLQDINRVKSITDKEIEKGMLPDVQSKINSFIMKVNIPV